MISSEANKKN